MSSFFRSKIPFIRAATSSENPSKPAKSLKTRGQKLWAAVKRAASPAKSLRERDLLAATEQFALARPYPLAPTPVPDSPPRVPNATYTRRAGQFIVGRPPSPVSHPVFDLDSGTPPSAASVPLSAQSSRGQFISGSQASLPSASSQDLSGLLQSDSFESFASTGSSQSGFVPSPKIQAIRAKAAEYKAATAALKVAQEGMRAALQPLPDVPKQPRRVSSASLSSSPSSVETPSQHSDAGESPRLSPAHQKLVDRAATLGVYAGDPEISATAKVLDVSIRVFKKGPNGQFSLYRHFDAENTSKAPLNIAWNGDHFEPMIQRENGWITRATPADGDCWYHAVSEAANLPAISNISVYNHIGELAKLKKARFYNAMLGNKAPEKDEELYSALRQPYVLQLRHEVSRELAKPKYEAFALVD